MIKDFTSETFKAGFDEITDRDIVIAPWLAMRQQKDRLTRAQEKELRKNAREYAALSDSVPIPWWGEDALSDDEMTEAYYDILVSTAAYLSHMRLGTLVIPDEMTFVADRLCRECVQQDGGYMLLSLYSRIMMYLDGQLLHYYGRVPETAFVSGAWHRPWVERPLQRELELGLQHGVFVQTDEDGECMVGLSELGRSTYEDCRHALDMCGYLRQREQLMRASNFTNMEDYERILEDANPTIHDIRKALIAWSDIRPGMRVLELGAGAGALTFDDGLYEVVGSDGELVATDPSVGMLARAEKKRWLHETVNVELRQASAEKLPFPDDTFDAVIGALFLHFTDVPSALREIKRVLKPGGTFTAMYSLDFSKPDPFLSEWFSPLFERGLTSQNRHVMPKPDEVPRIAENLFESFTLRTEEWPTRADNVEDVVTFLVKAGTMAMLRDLPWRASEELYDELIERGYRVKSKFGADAMRLRQRVQWFKGRV